MKRVLSVGLMLVACLAWLPTASSQCASYPSTNSGSGSGSPSPAPNPSPRPAPVPGITTAPAGGGTTGGSGLRRKAGVTWGPQSLYRTRMHWIGSRLPRKDSKYDNETVAIELLADGKYAHKDAKAGRPILVSFYTEDGDDEQLDNYESRLWADADIGIASRLFNCYRICLDDIESPVDRKKYGSQPRIMIMDASGKMIYDMKGWNTTNRRLFKSLRSVIKTTWKKDILRLIPKHFDILAKLDRLHADTYKAKTILKTAKAHLRVHAKCVPTHKRIKKTTKEMVALEKETKKAEAKEAKLYAFLKPAKVEAKEKPVSK